MYLAGPLHVLVDLHAPVDLHVPSTRSSIYLLSIIMDYRAYQLRVDLTQFKPSATLDCIDQLFSQHLLALVLGKFEQIHTGGARG